MESRPVTVLAQIKFTRVAFCFSLAFAGVVNIFDLQFSFSAKGHN
jgi:hypothetical protein